MCTFLNSLDLSEIILHNFVNFMPKSNCKLVVPSAVREDGSCLERVCRSVVLPLPLSPIIPTRAPVPTLPPTPGIVR